LGTGFGKQFMDNKVLCLTMRVHRQVNPKQFHALRFIAERWGIVIIRKKPCLSGASVREASSAEITSCPPLPAVPGLFSGLTMQR
jgi:hypothetical protein